MKIINEVYEYLKGEKFSNGYYFKIEEKYTKNECKERIEKILELTKGKNVLHLGCCDHIPLIKTKIKNNTYLQKLLTENCKEVLGLDINQEAIDYLKKEIGYKNLKYCDITDENKDEEILNKNWDFLVMGEILEHVNNPVEFLEKIRKNYGKNIQRILITVPNIICRGRMEKIIEEKAEEINSDHRYWFTPYTILKCAEMSGLKDFKLYFVDRCKVKNKGLEKLKRKVKRIIFGKNKEIYYFYDFSTLILEAKLEGKESDEEIK